jgi:hypothetical protein
MLLNGLAPSPSATAALIALALLVAGLVSLLRVIR